MTISEKRAASNLSLVYRSLATLPLNLLVSLALADGVQGNFTARVERLRISDADNVYSEVSELPWGIKIGDQLRGHFSYDPDDATTKVFDESVDVNYLFSPLSASIHVDIDDYRWSSDQTVYLRMSDNTRHRDSRLFSSSMRITGMASRFPFQVDSHNLGWILFHIGSLQQAGRNNLVASVALPTELSSLDLSYATDLRISIDSGPHSDEPGNWIITGQIDPQSLFIGSASAPDPATGSQVTPSDFDNHNTESNAPPPLSQSERDFLAGIERVDRQPRQRLGMQIGSWSLIGPEGPLVNGMHEILKDLFINAAASAAEPCARNTWEVATGLAGKRFVAEGVSYLTEGLLNNTVDVAMAPFSLSSKLLIAESLKFGLGLVNDHQFGLLESRDIPEDAARRITQITIGYTFPLLVEGILEQDLSESLLDLGASGVSNTLLGTYFDNEHLVQVVLEGTATPRLGGSAVNVRIGAFYNEDTHFVTMFVRSNGGSCDESMVRVLRFEINEDGLPVDREDVRYDEIELR